MRLNSQPSHIVSFLPGMTTCVRWGRGDGVRVGLNAAAARPSSAGPSTRRPCSAAARRSRWGGPCASCAAPRGGGPRRGRPFFFAELSLVRRGLRGTASASPRRAGWVLARERCGRCNCACCCFAGHAATAVPLAKIRARAILGAAMALHFGLRHLDGSACAVPLVGRRGPPARYVLGSRMVTNCFA